MDNTGFSPKRLIPVKICYAEPEKQILLDIEVPENTRLAEAISQSGIAEKLPFSPTEGEVGIFGKKRPFDAPLKAYDRIEIYRPLKTSLQEARRLRIRDHTGN